MESNLTISINIYKKNITFDPYFRNRNKVYNFFSHFYNIWCLVQGYSFQCILISNILKISKYPSTKHQFKKLCYIYINSIQYNHNIQ